MTDFKSLRFLGALLICMLISGCSNIENNRDNAIKPGTTVGMKNVKSEETFDKAKTAKTGVYLGDKNVGGMEVNELEKVVKEYSSKSDLPPTDAKFNESNWSIATESKPGKKVNTKATIERVLNANEGEKVALVVEDVQPSVPSKNFTDNITLISHYSTPILDGSGSRLNNIKLAIEKIDYKKLQPGEEFSFNATVGRRSEDKGYEMAPVIVKSEDGYKKGYDFGGGICQISSTMYNAVEQCGLEITERHIHTKDVGYVQKGNDATVSYGGADFKFVNNRSYPLMLRIFMEGGEIRTEIFENTIN